MPQIVLNDVQASIVRTSAAPVEIVDCDGNWLGFVSGSFSREEIEEAGRRASSKGPWHATREVLDRLMDREII